MDRKEFLGSANEYFARICRDRDNRGLVNRPTIGASIGASSFSSPPHRSVRRLRRAIAAGADYRDGSRQSADSEHDASDKRHRAVHPLVTPSPRTKGERKERKQDGTRHGLEPARPHFEELPGVGIEPTRPEGHGILSPERLPVPPPRRALIVRAPGLRAAAARSGTSSPPPLGALPQHSPADEQVRFVGVVRTTTQGDVLLGRRPACGARLDMVELQERRLPASAIAADERATSAIPLPDGASDSRRDVPRAWRGAAGGARRLSRRQPLPFDSSVAISSSTCRLLRCRAAAIRVAWFSAVRCGASSRTVVRFPCSQLVEDRRILPSRAGHLDAVVGGALRQV